MARAPRASVSKTSGQGVSRLSYQQGRRLSGAGGDARVSADFGSGDNSRERYAKTSKTKYPSEMNVSYAHTLAVNDLDDVKALGEGKPAKASVTDKRERPKKFR